MRDWRWNQRDCRCLFVSCWTAIVPRWAMWQIFLWSSAYANVYHLLAAGDSCHSNRNNSNNKQRKNEKNYYKKLFAHCATQYKNNHKLLSHSRIFVMCCRRVNCKLWCCNHFTNYVVNFVNHILLATIDFGYLINRTFFSLFFCSVKFKAKAIIR